MITFAGVLTNAGTTEQRRNGTEMTDGKLYESSTVGSGYSQAVAQQMTMKVLYDVTPVTSDTQGAIDFYLQVVD